MQHPPAKTKLSSKSEAAVGMIETDRRRPSVQQSPTRAEFQRPCHGITHAAGQHKRAVRDTTSKWFLISKKLQPWALPARSTLTPTLSRERERESEQVGSLSRVLVGEGWGEGDLPAG